MVVKVVCGERMAEEGPREDEVEEGVEVEVEEVDEGEVEEDEEEDKGEE